MPEIKKLLKLSKLEYYKTHLSIINCLLPVKLTPKEIEVLASFMSLEGDIAVYRFGKTGRKIIMEQLELSTSGLSNYIISLTNKGFLKEVNADNNTILIHPILVPENTEQIYSLKLEKILV